MKLRLIGPALFAMLTLASEVSAEPPPSPSWSGRPYPLDGPPRPEVKTITRWYGWQTLVGVGASDSLIVAGIISAANDGADLFSGRTIGLTVAGLAGHVFSGPIVHWAHGFGNRGVSSLGMNLLLPTAGMWIGYALGSAGDRPDVGFIAGTLAGLTIGPALDVAFLTYKEVPAQKPAGDRVKWARSLTVIPLYGRGRTGLSIAGSF